MKQITPLPSAHLPSLFKTVWKARESARLSQLTGRRKEIILNKY